MKWAREAIMNKKELSKDSTVYHYRLLKRIHYNSILILIYWGILVGIFIWEVVSLWSFSMLFALVLIPLLHTMLIYLHVTLKEKRTLAHWFFRIRLPWLGFAPTYHISLQKYRSIQLQVLWITIMIIGCFYPWVAHDLILNLLLVHLWIFLPRLMIFFRFRKHSKIGLMKLNEKDTSCYSQ
jgi:hypothetical protein